MIRWLTGSLVVRFTFSFILHQFLLMLVLAIPGVLYIYILQEPDNLTMIKILSWVAVAFYFLYCLFYGYYFARPMYGVLNRIEVLSNGEYLVPKQKKQFLSSRIYREVNTNLESLSTILQENEKKRKEFNKRRQEWAAGVTHDLKTPLSYISGYTDMLLSAEHTWSEAERIEFLQLIKEKSRHMEELISDLGIAFRMDQSLDIKRNSEKIELTELLRRVVAEAANMPVDKEISFEFIGSNHPVYIKGDIKLLKRAFTNLIVNAVEHNPAGTVVKVTIEKKDQVEVVIEDNGIGMDEDAVNHLFERYYRGTPTNTPTGGTGLGMAIVQQIIAAYGGSIEVSSELGCGTAITVKLSYD
ncbi:sensor histidine kinase [Oceanobacillus sojae]|uniref:sensor histidine kinase n=1 Tax=Oceanobacillus sojae TaxID=582851 RepID=UPI0009885C63|nr:HAMP domain-containing sensor histidine kinase [Oceanobacillus sojae]